MKKPNSKIISTIGGGGTVAGAVLWLLIEVISSGPVNARQGEQIKINKEKCQATQQMVKDSFDKLDKRVRDNGKKITKVLTLLGEE